MKITSSLVVPDRKLPAAPANALVHAEPQERLMLLVDHSGSMATEFGRKTRQEAAADAIQVIVSRSVPAVTWLGLTQFDDSAAKLVECTQNFSAIVAAGARIFPSGGTRYAPAIRACFEDKLGRIILVSDGEPSDPAAAIEAAHAARALGVKIDTIGVAETPGRILREISEITGGIYSVAKDIQTLTDTFAKLETRARLQLTGPRT